jgi:hypothetical protein
VKAAGPILAGVVAAVIAFAAGSGFMDIGTVLLVLVLSAVAVPLASRLGTEFDAWMWWVGPAAYLAKLAGAGVRYWVLVAAYEGVGDAVKYHNRGQEIAEIWRSLSVPSLGGGGGAGTQYVDSITGLVYAVHEPTMLGGFFIFATLAFIGQLLFYTAFRRSVHDGRLGVYAAFVLFLPGLVFWPSSIGKESLMIFFLGVATYGLARAFDGFRPLWLLVAAVGLAGAGIVRPHVAAILAASFAGAALVGRGRWQGWAGVRRVVVLAVATFLVGVSLSSFVDRYELESAEDVDPFVADIQRRTQQGGSSVEGGAVASPADLPEAFVRVLFRPLPHEAHNLQATVSAVENVALLGVVVWRLPWMVRRLRRLRTPYVMMSAAFTFVFVVAFSAIFNLGILSRQRAQVFPFFLAVVVALGWDAKDASKPAEVLQARRQGPDMPANGRVNRVAGTR